MACKEPNKRDRSPSAPADGPIVVNRHHYRGRALPRPWLYVGRNKRDPSKASPLANPYTVKEHGPAAITKYRAWLLAQVAAEDPVVMGELRKITPAHHLVCSCAPRPCHGDVVVEVWRAIKGGNETPG